MGTANMRRIDRIAIEEATLVLAAINARAQEFPEFAAHIRSLPVPGGKELSTFTSAIGCVAARYPTEWRAARQRELEEDVCG